MAILYGTQSNGETLPVLVDQFGNLLAKGIEGPVGPEGPPGIGQLPPDPFEGAVLGWQDDQLAWLGGSVPLPAGTYGPYTYMAGNEQLDIPQDATSLVNGQQLYMSDSKGNPAVFEYRTDTVASVGVFNPLPTNVSSTETISNPDNALDGDWGTAAYSEGVVTVTFTDAVIKPGESFWTYLVQNSSDTSTAELDLQDLGSVSYNTVNQTTNQFLIWRNNTNGDVTLNTCSINRVKTGGSATGSSVAAFAIVPDSAGLGTTPGNTATVEELEPYTLKASNALTILTFPTNNNFDKFEVGEVVQTGVLITGIDDRVPSITVDGGNWSAGVSYLETEWSGAGSVFMGLDGAIVLRNNNKEWVNDFYVTAPAQEIAARKVAANARKLRKK